jgi:hypothetical protein
MQLRYFAVSLFAASAQLFLLIAGSWRAVLAAHYEHPTKGYTIEYPDSWNRNTRMSPDEPLTLTNFPAGEYLRGGVLPPGGVEITMLALPSTMDENFLLVPYEHTTNVKRSVRSVGHRGILRADYDLLLPGSRTQRITSVCFREKDKLFRIMVSYERPQPHKDQIQAVDAALTEIVRSLQVKEGK